MNNLGLIHIYEGSGKGKTSAAIGLAIRTLGYNKRVAFVQFLKGRHTGEISPLEQLGVDVFRTHSVKKFLSFMTPAEREVCQQDVEKAFGELSRCLASKDYDLVIADELLDVINCNLLLEDDIISALKAKHEYTEVVLTGRNPSDKLCQLADYITNMSATKHPFEKGISGRKCIEF